MIRREFFGAPNGGSRSALQDAHSGVFCRISLLFFADWAARFDLGTIEWLDKEILPNPPEGSRHVLDLIARLRAKEPVAGSHSEDSELWLALIHIEIESPDRTVRLKPRLPHYYIHLRG